MKAYTSSFLLLVAACTSTPTGSLRIRTGLPFRMRRETTSERSFSGVGEGEEGDFVPYYREGDQNPEMSYVRPVVNPSVPLSNPSAPDRQKFILLGGFDQEHGFPDPPYDPEQGIKLHGQDFPANFLEYRLKMTEEGDPERREEGLRQFVRDAIHFFLTALDGGEVDVIQLRRLFRLDDGPWRHRLHLYLYHG